MYVFQATTRHEERHFGAVLIMYDFCSKIRSII